MTEKDWDMVININLKSVFNLTKAVQRTMLKAKKGSIVNMSSVVGLSSNAGQSNYSASKATKKYLICKKEKVCFTNFLYYVTPFTKTINLILT